jgi:peptidoglycan hydrolase-like protein with peptidoglycan-binding domain
MLLGALAASAAAAPAGEPVQRPLPSAAGGAVSLDAMWGEPMRELQRTLDRLGYDTGPIDGIAGVRTSAALREFQSCNGLDAHGRLDRSTRSLLHLEEGEMFARNQPDEIVRERQGVDPPAVSDDPQEAYGSDPLDASSMPTAGDAEEPVDADDFAPVAGRETDWMAAVSKKACVERRTRPANPRP